jgi:hypothetical protein
MHQRANSSSGPPRSRRTLRSCDPQNSCGANSRGAFRQTLTADSMHRPRPNFARSQRLWIAPAPMRRRYDTICHRALFSPANGSRDWSGTGRRQAATMLSNPATVREQIWAETRPNSLFIREFTGKIAVPEGSEAIICQNGAADSMGIDPYRIPCKKYREISWQKQGIRFRKTGNRRGRNKISGYSLNPPEQQRRSTKHAYQTPVDAPRVRIRSGARLCL